MISLLQSQAHSSAVKEEFEQLSARWRDCSAEAQKANADLLRLSLLKDLQLLVHTEQSHLLAKGLQEETRMLAAVEQRLERLRKQCGFPPELAQTLLAPQDFSPATRSWPHPLATAIGVERIDRFDRQWEKAITSEAYAKHWSAWTLQCTMGIREVESWTRTLAKTIWPQALILFVECAQQSSDQTPPPGHWPGRWFLLLAPGVSDTTLQCRPPSGSLSEISWQRLYP